MDFDDGGLRYIRLGDREVLRRVYVAVRDPGWATIPIELSNLKADIEADAFFISFQADHREGPIHFAWQGALRGDAQGTLTLDMDGEVRSTFLRSRIGICVLHPIDECAGQPCQVETVAGKMVNGSFPRLIAPHQPFFDMRAISHEVAPGVRATVRLEGDTFEMEDQRNWADASYKTYSTPLALPKPVEVKAGLRLRQSFKLSLEKDLPTAGPVTATAAAKGGRAAAPIEALDFSVEGQGEGHPVPKLGTAFVPGSETLGDKARERLAALRLAHLRVDLTPRPRRGQAPGQGQRPGQGPENDDWEASFGRAVAEARRLGLPLEVALSLAESPAEELRRFAHLLAEARPPLAAVLVLPLSGEVTPAETTRMAREILRQVDRGVVVSAGTNIYFTEVNRNRGVVDDADEICFPNSPQIHMDDDLTLVENISQTSWIADTARSFAGGRPLAMTPVTLKPQPRPAPRAVFGPPPAVPRHVDVRQTSLFVASFTAAHIGYVARSGLARATYYQAAGWLGLQDDPGGAPPLPASWRVRPGGVFPLYHALADVGELAGGRVLDTTSQRPLAVDGLAIRLGGKTRVLLGNLTAERQLVRLGGAGGQGTRASIRRLDATTLAEATATPEAFRARSGAPLPAGPVELPPHALATVDIERSGR